MYIFDVYYFNNNKKWRPETIKNGAELKSHKSRKINITTMKKIIVSSVFLGLFLALSSFSLIENNLSFNQTSTELINSKDEVIITYDNSDICGLKFLGKIEVTEKWWFYNNNDLKTETVAELKKQAAEKGGNVVFVDIKDKKSWGIFFSTTIIGYVYSK